MLRLHFTADDIARVRVSPAPDHLWEITNSFQALTGAGDGRLFGEWRQRVRPRLRPSDGLLAALLPPRGYSPDFLTPAAAGTHSLDSAVDAVLATPRTTLRSDLALLAGTRRRPLPAGTRALADGEPEALGRLGSALRTYHRRALAPFLAHIRAQIDADLSARARAALEGGTQGLLASFRPVLRWEPPVLEADYPVARELRLAGRGLLLQPSFFCSGRPVMLAAPSPELTPVLVYPIQHTAGWARQRAGTAPDAVEALLGRNRAAVLKDVVTGRTTGELARRSGISGAAVSQHTVVLRRAGLLLSVRRGRHVLHTITPAGRALLVGPSRPTADA